MKRCAAAIFFLAFASPAFAQTPPSPLALQAIEQAQAAPEFKPAIMLLDVRRVQIAAGVQLDTIEQITLGEQAFNNKMWVESEAALRPLFDAGVLGGPSDEKRERNRQLQRVVYKEAANARDTLVANEIAAAGKYSGLLYTETGEGYFGLGDFAKAEELIRKGLVRGLLKPDEEAAALLHLGIAQLRNGKAAEARATWAAIRSNTGAEQLAAAWTVISQEAR